MRGAMPADATCEACGNDELCKDAAVGETSARPARSLCMLLGPHGTREDRPAEGALVTTNRRVQKKALAMFAAPVARVRCARRNRHRKASARRPARSARRPQTGGARASPHLFRPPPRPAPWPANPAMASRRQAPLAGVRGVDVAEAVGQIAVRQEPVERAAAVGEQVEAPVRMLQFHERRLAVSRELRGPREQVILLRPTHTHNRHIHSLHTYGTRPTTRRRCARRSASDRAPPPGRGPPSPPAAASLAGGAARYAPRSSLGGRKAAIAPRRVHTQPHARARMSTHEHACAYMRTHANACNSKHPHACARMRSHAQARAHMGTNANAHATIMSTHEQAHA